MYEEPLPHSPGAVVRHPYARSKSVRASSNPESSSTPKQTRSHIYKVHKAPDTGSKGRHATGKSNRLKDIQDALSDSSSSLSSSTSAPFSLSTPPVWTPRETLRDVYIETARNLYPYYTPKNDFEILVLSGGSYRGVALLEGIMQHIEEEMEKSIDAWQGTREFVLQNATKTLDTKADITGLKPRAGDPGVYIRPLPNSEYSIRLFPGSKVASEYCLDFVLSATGEPVNSPFKFNLFAGPGPTTPVGFAPTVGIQSLERSFGVAPKDMRPGAEKFVLRDGQLCTLQRPGHNDVQFTVPLRRRPEPPKPNVDILELPQYASV
ncbi:hypothetical protein C2E23DRAFT_494194 [Lenzites betulinus]|nr:hypothetical protein C2E23DRAFT_494194 [Lenzites betulinus]